MQDDILAEQRALVDRIEEAGWAVTETELSVYESPWEESDDPEATVVITARKPFPTDGEEGDGDDDQDESPYRVK